MKARNLDDSLHSTVADVARRLADARIQSSPDQSWGWTSEQTDSPLISAGVFKIREFEFQTILIKLPFTEPIGQHNQRHQQQGNKPKGPQINFHSLIENFEI
jgi:hypothetical protein